MICSVRFWCRTDQPHRRHHGIISSGTGRPTAALVHQGSLLTFPEKSFTKVEGSTLVALPGGGWGSN